MKKMVAVILELIPVLSALLAYILFQSQYNTELIRTMILVAIILSFNGFAFGIAGCLLAGKDKIVKILALLDFLTTGLVVGFYILVIFLFGL